jgi:hypothetical protein
MPRETAGAGWIRSQFNIYVPLPAGTGAAEIVTDFIPGFRFFVEKVRAYVAIVGTGASATRTLRVVKGTATVVASATVTLASTDTLGEEQVFTITDADKEFNDGATLTVDFAAGGTAFTAGALNMIVQYRARQQQLG